MVFAKPLRERVRSGRIRCTIRIWMQPHVKVGGRYAMDEGSVVVDSIAPLKKTDLTKDLARFHYLPSGGWDRVDRRKDV